MSTEEPTNTPEPPEPKWGDPISDERQAKLQAILDTWNAEADHGERKGPFEGASLPGADVFWLAERVRYVGLLHDLHLEGASLYSAHLEGADLRGAHLEGANFQLTHLEGANLHMAQLARASFHWTHLEGAVLDETDLERATFNQSLLEGASLRAAYLPRVFLSGAFLMGADLEYAHLKEAILRGALLMGARLTAANLEGANLRGAHMDGMVYAPDEPSLARVRQFAPNFPATLSPADLSGAFFDSATDLYGAVLATAKRGAVRVADVRWGGVNLAVVPDWAPFTEQKVPLGDERAAWEWKPEPFTETAEQQKQPQRTRRQARTAHDQQQARERRVTFQAAVRANRQLATALRGQGMNEEADYFAYRAQVVQRQVQRQQGIRKWPVYIGSFILDLIAGYGYHPERSFLVYLAAIVWFANAYRLFGGLPPLDASVFSMASFHGRGFFPSESFTLHSPVAILAGVEAFFGLLIEITFIATFTQRFFAR